MNINQFKTEATLKIEEESSKNNPNSKKVIQSYFKTVNGINFLYQKIITKSTSTEKIYCYKKTYKIDNKGVCKRVFINNLL